ncbi:MAG: hypothetical protein J1G02_06495 [Clostridiales bacterium]|nr:hypothetical protein [Clostridiales bacterium]
MKKTLALILTCLLLFGSVGVVAFAAISEVTEQPTVAAANNTIYLVPGTYVSGGNKVENTIASGARKLSQDECDAIFTENAYECTLAVGTALPEPSSVRVDKSGNPYTFNGWWAIVDATVTYFDKVPAMTVVTFLYADWRADLSQRLDPAQPGEEEESEFVHYLEIKRASGATETVKLRAATTDRANAESLGHGRPVELYNEDLQLSPGDVITVYTTGLGDGELQYAPIITGTTNNRSISLESSSTSKTADYFTTDKGTTRKAPTLTCKDTMPIASYKIYIKFYSGGSMMAVYMEPKQ